MLGLCIELALENTAGTVVGTSRHQLRGLLLGLHFASASLARRSSVLEMRRIPHHAVLRDAQFPPSFEARSEAYQALQEHRSSTTLHHHAAAYRLEVNKRLRYGAVAAAPEKLGAGHAWLLAAVRCSLTSVSPRPPWDDLSNMSCVAVVPSRDG